jgi:hypothetical protein
VDPDDVMTSQPVPGVLRAAALASIGAGAVHAAAAWSHADATGATAAFAALAAAQIAWGVVALARSGPGVRLAGLALNGGAVAGWVVARTAAEPPGLADTVAAGLAALAVLGALAAGIRRPAWVARPHPALVGVAGVAALGLAVPGVVGAGGHDHRSDHGHDTAATGSGTAGTGHDTAGTGHDTAGTGHDMAAMPGMDHGHDAPTVAPKPFTGTLPVDLGGVPGVTAAQQQSAEDLVTRTIQRLPQFADYTAAEGRGWHTIGDDLGPGSFEHFINWPLVDDGRTLDPDAPESLVYQVQPDGSKKLAAAMYLLGSTSTFDDVPDVGGRLVQWHIHNNICLGGEVNAWRYTAIVRPEQPCPPGSHRFPPTAPMLHVWITPTQCGPFAALDGIAGGQIEAGETRLCDTAHGTGAAVSPFG